MSSSIAYKFIFRPLHWFIPLVVAGTLCGCKWWPGSNLSLDDSNPPSGRAKLDFKHFQCLKEIDKNIISYLKGESSEEIITKQSDCILFALDRFQYFANDYDKFADGSYSPEGLSTFLNKHYLDDNSKLSPGLVQEIMAFKVLILGGKSDRLTSDEFRDLSDLVRFIDRQAKLNLRHIPVYRLANKKTTDRQNAPAGEVTPTILQVNAAQSQLRATGLAFVKLLERHGNPYSLVNLEKLITEIKSYLDWQNYYDQSLPSKQIVELIRAYKDITTGSGDDQIDSRDWLPIVDSGTRLYGVYLNYKILIEKLNISHGEPLLAFTEAFRDVFDVLENIVVNSPSGNISFRATDALFFALEQAGYLNFESMSLRATSISAVYRQLINFGLVNRDELPVNSGRGLGLPELREAKSEFELWARAQQYLSRNADLVMEKNNNYFQLRNKMIKNFVNTFDLSGTMLSDVKIDEPENSGINDIVARIRPLFKENDSRAYIAHMDQLEDLGVFHNLYNLTRMNLIRGLIRILIRSFAVDDERAKNITGLTESETIQFMDLVKPFAVDIKFLDPRAQGTGPRIFSEGNLFTYSGDGANYKASDDSRLINFYEWIELFSLLISGGHIQSSLHTNMLNYCFGDNAPNTPLDNAFYKPKLKRDTCFSPYFVANYDKEYQNLPNLVSYLVNLSPKQVVEFGDLAQKIAFSENSIKDYIEYSELAVVNTAFHYIEVLFTVYDSNKNGELEAEEILKAYPRFEGYLNRMVEDSQKTAPSANMTKAIFTFLVIRQKLPNWWDYSALKYFDFRYTMDHNFVPEMKLDRMKLMRVLSVLAEENLKALLEKL